MSKKETKKMAEIGKLIMVIILVMFIAVAVVQSQTLEQELSQLENDLINSGYEWLINYSVSSSVEVYEVNGNITIANFSEIGEDKEYKVFLSNLGQGQCYDSETEVLTDEGWKYFADLNGNEEVMTLNAKTGEKEWQKPSDYQEFEHEGEMYEIVLEDYVKSVSAENKESRKLLVSPKHKVYASIEGNNFELMPITIVYDLINEGKEVYFLDSENKPIKVKSIEKEDYKGKIYDVDVPNDIILVRRWNSSEERESYYEYLNNDVYNMVEADAMGSSSKESLNNMIKYPLKSFGDDFFSSNFENEFSKFSGLSCGILNQTIENIFSLGNNDELMKCVSLVTSILCSERENSANLPLESDFGLNVTSYSLDFKNSNSSFFTFSSSRNLSSFLWDDGDIILASSNYSSVMQSCFDMLFSEGGKERIRDFFNRHSSFEHFENLPDHDSSASESRNSSTDFSVNDNIFINFDSHVERDSKELYKDFELITIEDAYEIVNSGKELFLLDKGVLVNVNSIEKVQDETGAVWSGNSEGYSQDTFDLRIVGPEEGFVEFDYIVDPTIELRDNGNVFLTTTYTLITELNTSFPAGNNFIITAVQLNGTSGMVNNQSMFLTRNQQSNLTNNSFEHRFSSCNGCSNQWTMIYLDNNAPANANYSLIALANSTNTIQAEGKILVFNGVNGNMTKSADQSLLNDILVTSLELNTTFPAGNNLVFAVVELFRGTTGAEELFTGRINLTSQKTDLVSNLLPIIMGAYTGGASATTTIFYPYYANNSNSYANYSIKIMGQPNIRAKSTLVALNISLNWNVFYNESQNISLTQNVNVTIANLTTNFTKGNEIVGISSTTFYGETASQTIRATDLRLQQNYTTINESNNENIIQIPNTGGTGKGRMFTLLGKFNSSGNDIFSTIAATSLSSAVTYGNSKMLLIEFLPPSAGAGAVVLSVFLLSPANASTATTNITYFQARFTDDTNVTNATLYVWNGTNELFASNFTTLGNSSITTNLSIRLNYTGTFFWNYLAVDNSNNQAFNNSNFTLTFSLNTAPNNPSTKINSTDGTNRTAQDLHCFDTITDSDSGDRLNVSVQWYNNSVLHFYIDYNSSYINGTLFDAILDNANTTRYQNWSCGIRLYDGTAYSAWVNSSIGVNISNTLPNVSLLSPPNNNYTTNRTPIFNWTGSDDDGDTLSYELNLTCLYAPSGTCSSGNRYINNNTLNATTLHKIGDFLEFLYDNNYYYNWTVRAYDGIGFGSWANPRNLSIQGEISISLPVASVNFGSMNNSQSRNTSGDNPAPLVLRNTGNTLLNVSINFTSLFSTALSPTDNFQYRIRNTTKSCFASAATQTDYTQAPTATTQAINQFNFTAGYQTPCNNVSVDILVTVPIDESSGNKNSIVTFIASLGEPGFGSN